MIRHSRRRLFSLLTMFASSQWFVSPVRAASVDLCTWPAWETYRALFVQPDGRVVDHSAAGHSTSEGQVYSLFFALLAVDRKSFARILSWTRDNLSGGDLAARLMAWRWGKRTDGRWGVLDTNAASDADLWLAYTLFQAGRLWQDKQLTATAKQVAERVAQELVVSLPEEVTLLLPGPQGFKLEGDGYKLNPSYQPIFLLRALAKDHPQGPWLALLRSTISMIDSVAPKGIVPDWVVYYPKKGFAASQSVGCKGSYDAIRVYLWAALTSPLDPDRARVLNRLQGYAQLLDNILLPPESADACSGKPENHSPAGFSAAVLPFLQEVGAKSAFERLRRRLAVLGGVPNVYYEQSLGLFSEGWLDKRYRFEFDGRLLLSNNTSCIN